MERFQVLRPLHLISCYVHITCIVGDLGQNSIGMPACDSDIISHFAVVIVTRGSHHQGQHQSQSHYHHAKKGKYSTGGSETGHLMAPSGPAGAGFNHCVAAAGFNPGVAAAAPGLNPALGQALTALLTSQGAGLGIGNLLGGFTGAAANQGAHAAGYGNQVAGGYGNQMGVQGGYHNPQLGQGGAGRSQPGGGAPYMGH